MRSTLLDAKNSRIPVHLNLCTDDTRIPQYVNDAQLRLLNMGTWWGTRVVIRLCVQNSCITWPREVGAVLAINANRQPFPIRSEWYSFQSMYNGFNWIWPQGCCGTSIGWGNLTELSGLMRGTACSFSDIVGPGKKLRVFCDPSDVGKRLLLAGRDQNNIWIRSIDPVSGAWVDGEYVTLALPFVDTVNFFSVWTDCQKDLTNAIVRVFESDTVSLTIRALATYEPSETNPQYQRTYINTLCGAPFNIPSCTTQIDALVKLAYIPAVLNSDWLVIGNLAALDDMCQSLKAKENGDMTTAAIFQKSAIKALNDELRSMTGDRTTVQINSQGTARLSYRLANMR